MESIKVYFRNALIGFATMVLASLAPTQLNSQKPVDMVDDEDNFHMFI